MQTTAGGRPGALGVPPVSAGPIVREPQRQASAWADFSDGAEFSGGAEYTNPTRRGGWPGAADRHNAAFGRNESATPPTSLYLVVGGASAALHEEFPVPPPPMLARWSP